MPHRTIILILTIITISTNSYSQNRTLEITGLKIYTADELIDLLNLTRYENGTMSAQELIDSIISFYSNGGYTLVKAYVTENSETSLKIYIDEGALGKIIFLNMDDFTTLYLKIAFRLKHKIFNYYAIQDNIDNLKKGKRWKDITWQLKPVKDYDTSLLQLDRELNLPLIGKKVLPFFDRYGPRYDLVIIFSKNINPYTLDDTIIDRGKKEKTGDKKPLKKTKKSIIYKFDYGLKVNYYRGFIPYLKYSQLGLFSSGDFFMSEATAGVMYGLDLKFKRPPRETYFNFGANYFFTPTFKDFFTPHIKIDLLQSKSARPDLELVSYNYLVLNAMLAPGITFLKNTHLYTGIGVETAFIFKSEFNRYAVYKYNVEQILSENTMQKVQNVRNYFSFKKEVNNHTDVYNYIEIGFIYDFSKKSDKVYELRKNRLRKELVVAYDFFFLKKYFNRIRLMGYYEHEFKNRSIYSGILSYNYSFINVPFYHETSVSNTAFMGLHRLTYHSRNILSQANEYRISVYKDFLYVGAFFDMTLFEGSGRDLKGAQFGIVGGPTVRVLILDHFELYLQYGWDYLLSTKDNDGYLYFNIYNKW